MRQNAKGGVPSLGHRQTEIMNVLWERGPLTPSQIHEALNARASIAYTTVHTELSRLRQKKLVTRDRDSRYAPVLSREEYRDRQVAGILGDLLSMHGEVAIHGFMNLIAHDERQLDIVRRSLRGNKKT